MMRGQTQSPRDGTIQLGTYGHLGIFIWLISMVMVFPPEKLAIPTSLCLVLIALIYPFAFNRLFNTRLIFFSLVFVIPPIFFIGEADHIILGLSISNEGALIGLQAGVRLIIVLLAVNGFTSSVNIPSLAGVLEKFGLQGLGFSIGVAINLVPTLRDTAIKTWHSLKMRGGLRKNWLRGMQLYLIVVITNALRHTEEIALAAESRGFSPEKARPMAIKSNKTDWVVLPICVISLFISLAWTQGII
jgi:energy-coupling factor transporter transmembrane protein EcfT